jgi:hypothetical protein
MAVNYPEFFTRLQTLDTDINNSWSLAQSELNAQGAPDTIFLEITYSGGKILRLWDGSQVNGLSESEQLRLYPQLNGLFRKASLALLMP